MTNDQCPHCPCVSSSSPLLSITFHTSGSCSLRDDEDVLCRGDHATWRTLLRVGLNLSCNLYSSSFLNDKKSVLIIEDMPATRATRTLQCMGGAGPLRGCKVTSRILSHFIVYARSNSCLLERSIMGQSLGREIVESTCSPRAFKVAAAPNSYLARVCKHDARRRWLSGDHSNSFQWQSQT